MILKLPKFGSRGGESPIPKGYQPWLLLSLAVLVISLFVLAVVATIAFIYYVDVLTPLWLILLGAASAGGVALGFGGFFLLLVIGAYSSFKQDRISRLPPPE